MVAAVWVVAAAGFALCFLYGGTVVRAIGALVLVGATLRAVLALVKALFGGKLRRLRVLSTPRPMLAGVFESVALADVATLAVVKVGGSTYLQAVTRAGTEHTLVDLDPAHADDYRALAAWALARAGRQAG